MIISLELLFAVSYVLGFFLAIDALWKSRTPQGATAWVLALILMPIITIPIFLIFGKSRFSGKIKIKELKSERALEELKEIETFLDDKLIQTKDLKSLDRIADCSVMPGFTNGNHTELLINGEQTYREMLKSINEAQSYILFQFYIFRFDEAGLAFIDALIKKSKEGVKVYFLCDKIGTTLNKKFIHKMKDNGIHVGVFHSSKNWESRFQINFRNHRKLIIVDGKECFTGGLNIGMDYLGKDPVMGFWRDTAIKLQGPSVKAAQISFIKDWFWSQEEVLDLNWTPDSRVENAQVMVQHTGPNDPIDAAHLIHIQLINEANEKLWIATPYFIPSESILNAIILAKIRGVDVRLILPSYSDNLMLLYATQVYVEKLLKYHIPIYFYEKGFLHQKVLVTEKLASVGSLNMDSRSFFLNFEIFTLSNEDIFVGQVQKMFEMDFGHSRLVTTREMDQRPWWKKLLSRFFNLFSPML